MKSYKILITIFMASIVLFACEDIDFLKYTPKGSMSASQLETPENVEKMCYAAYAGVAAGQWRAPYTSQWLYGSVRSDNSYKGGGGVADQRQWNFYEGFTHVTPDLGDWAGTEQMWGDLYKCVQRANQALSGLNALDDSEFPLKGERVAEMRFLRAHFYFRLKVLFKHFVYLDETVADDSIQFISNSVYTDQELWQKIADEFKYAGDNLPPSQAEAGRANKFVAKAYLAKTRLFQAYEQNEQHAVININSNYLEEVVALTNEVINSGQYGLFDDIRKNFLWDFENGIESLFAAQYSLGDGTPMGNIDMEEALNYNTSSRYGCCSFLSPSQNLVNAHKTDPQTGLPLFDSFNDTPLTQPQDYWDNTIDPRLDHTVGIPTHPFKYDPTFIYDNGFVRSPSIYGDFSDMRGPQHPDCPCKTVAKGYAYDTDSHNEDIIRFDEVLLWKAEALIQLGREDEALPIINDIRGRAKNSTSKLVMEDGSPTSNYLVELYVPGGNCEWTNEFAMKALIWERRLEFAMEGRRFYDLVRWGIAEEVLNPYLEVERVTHLHLKEASFTKGRDEYLPIHQSQINLSKGLYEQNYGYN